MQWHLKVIYKESIGDVNPKHTEKTTETNLLHHPLCTSKQHTYKYEKTTKEQQINKVWVNQHNADNRLTSSENNGNTPPQ